MFLTDPRIRAAYAEGAGVYRIVPAAVAIPQTQADVVALVQRAAETRTAFIPRGAGSGMPGGNVGPGAIVDMSAGFSELSVDPQRRSARAGASVTWAQVNAAAKPYGLRLPPDPSSGPFATSGGMVSTNAAGPRTVRYGSVRRWVEALEVVEADGSTRTVKRAHNHDTRFALTADGRRLIAQNFPRTRKNSSGYALDRLRKRATRWTSRWARRGRSRSSLQWNGDSISSHRHRGAVLGFSDLAAMAEAVPYLVSLTPSALEPSMIRCCASFLTPQRSLSLIASSSAKLQRRRAASSVMVRGLKHALAHVETAVDRRGLDKLWELRRLASPALARLPLSQRSLQVIEDGCVPLERLGDYVAGLRDASTRHGIPVAIFGHAGDGHVHVNALPDVTRPAWREALRGLFDDGTELLVHLGGVPSGEHGVGRLRAGVLERFYGREVMELFRDVKRAYDPLTILNPGVIIPASDWSPLAALKVGDDAAAIPDDIAAQLRDVERSAAWATSKLQLAR